MKSTSNGVLGLAVLVLGLAAPTLVTVPAHAQGDLELTYSDAETSADGKRVSWEWTVKNEVGEPVRDVTLVHRLDPPLSDVKVTKPCKVTGEVIKCRWETLAAGGTRQGIVDAALPANTADTPSIKGQVTWQREITEGPEGSARDE